MTAPSTGSYVRVWWAYDGAWHDGRVKAVRAEHGEFLVDYLEAEDGEAWTGVSEPWQPLALLAEQRAQGAAEALPAPSEQELLRSGFDELHRRASGGERELRAASVGSRFDGLLKRLDAPS